MYDLYFSIALFFSMGVMFTLIVRGLMEFRASRQKERDDAIIRSIKSELHQLKLEIMKGKF